MTIDNRQQLLGTINSQIKLNGTGAITGPILNNVLDTMVNSALFYTGNWSAYTNYAPLDVVFYNNGSYVAIAVNVNVLPTDTAYWAPFAVASVTYAQVVAALGYVPLSSANGAVGSANLATGAVTSTAIAANAVVTAGIAANAVTSAKLASSLDITLNTLNNGQLAGTRNPIINGSFQVWQLGISFTLGTHLQKNADRWNFDFNGTTGTGTITRVQVPVTAWTSTFYPVYCARINQSAAGTGNTFYDFSTQIEGVGIFAGQTVTISFYAICDTSKTATLTAVKTEQYFGSGGSPSSPAFTASSPITLTASWARYSVQATLASVSGKTLGTNGDDTLNVIFTLPLNVTFDIYITDVQIESGSVATPFEYRSRAAVMDDCQRYLVTSYDDGVAPGTVTTNGAICFTQGSASTVKDIQLPTKMRTFPAMSYYNPATGASGSWNNAGAPATVATNTNGQENVSVSVTGGASGAFMTGHYVAQDPLL